LWLLGLVACSGNPGPGAVAPSPSPPAQGAGEAGAAGLRANGGLRPYTQADVHFMAGMIGHHAQAVQMAKWAPTHGANQSVQALCARIAVGQTDEIHMMQSWLATRHEFVPPADPRGHMMPGTDMPMLMPGMLSPPQMAQLDSARGSEFDRLFLTSMIMHHQGALTMVETLFGSTGAAQDDVVYRFASDVSADQSTEIARMNLMLDAMAPKQGQ
jgi:uncharacterized protein (DUF305 family)